MNLAEVWSQATRNIVTETLGQVREQATAHQATVTTVGPLTVSWNGATFPAAYLSTYVPTVGDRVLVLLVDGVPVVVGKIVGTPA